MQIFYREVGYSELIPSVDSGHFLYFWYSRIIEHHVLAFGLGAHDFQLAGHHRNAPVRLHV
jgi:hypothetical protein